MTLIYIIIIVTNLSSYKLKILSNAKKLSCIELCVL